LQHAVKNGIPYGSDPMDRLKVNSDSKVPLFVFRSGPPR
jgi:hypothetical protein